MSSTSPTRVRMSPGQPPRAADRARRTPARDAVARGPLHRDAGRGGGDLAGAALPLLRRQAGVPHRRRTPCGRRPVRRDGARRGGHRRSSSSRARWRATSTTSWRTTRATSRWSAVLRVGHEGPARDLRGVPRGAHRAGSSRAPVAEEAAHLGLVDTPAVRLRRTRAGRRCTEEVVLDWVRDNRGISREELLLILAGVAAGDPGSAGARLRSPRANTQSFRATNRSTVTARFAAVSTTTSSAAARRRQRVQQRTAIPRWRPGRRRRWPAPAPGDVRRPADRARRR